MVSVPVLSNTTVSTSRVASSAWWPLRNIPSWAPRPDATISAVGVANPSAHGHAITSTASAAETAWSTPAPAKSQAPQVNTAMAKTHGTKTPAMRSAIRCAVAFPLCACSTSRTMPASLVSEPTAAASITSRPLSATVPPRTLAPGRTSTGLASPVIALMSTAASPSTTSPSAAMVWPGRTTNRCCSSSSLTGTKCSVPSGSSTDTSLALSAANARSAPPARDLALASKYRPASTNTVTPAATSR